MHSRSAPVPLVGTFAAEPWIPAVVREVLSEGGRFREQFIRGIMLRGAALAEVDRDLWPLGAFFVVTMTLAMLRFRKRLDWPVRLREGAPVYRRNSG